MDEVIGEVTDILGAAVSVGDEVAAAFRVGNVAQLRVGTVQGFGERGNKLTVKVKWHTSSGYSREVDTNGAIEAELNRFVKLSANTATANP